MQSTFILNQGIFTLNFVTFPYLGALVNYYCLLNIMTAAIKMITLKNIVIQGLVYYFPEAETSLNTVSEPVTT